MFTDVALARRIEQAESSLVLEIAEAARGQPGYDHVLAAPIAGGAAVFIAAGCSVNKVAGMGFAGPVEEAALAEIERQFARHGSPAQVELSVLADNSIAALLTRR